MSAQCPNTNHPDWVYSVSKLGEDKTWFIYDRLGEQLPTKEQVDSITTPISLGETLYNKEQVIDSIVSELDESIIDDMKADLARMDKDEFNEMAKQAGLNSLGKYWTPSSVKDKMRSISPQQVISAISEAKSKEDIEKILMGYKGIINSKRWQGKVWLKQMNESSLDHIGLFKDLETEVNAVYPNLIKLDWKKAATFRTGHGVHEVVVDEYAWNRYVNRENDENYQQGTLFKRRLSREHADLMARESEEVNNFFRAATEIDNAYDYLNMAESFFGNVSSDHRKLIKIIMDLRKNNADISIKQVKKADLFNLFDTEEDASYHEDSLGFYRNGVVYINTDNLQDETKSMLVGTIAHEILHHYTLEVYYKWDRIAHEHNPRNEQLTPEESQFIKEIKSLFEAAKKRSKNKDHNAYRDLAEFMADGLSDQMIIDELKGMYDDTIGLTFWQQIKQFILKLFGLDYHPESYHSQLLGSVMDYVHKVRYVPSGVDIIQARKIKDNIHINYDNPTHNAIVDRLVAAEEFYAALPEKFEGVTTMMKRLLLGGIPNELMTEEKRKELEKYSGPGVETHYQIEKSFKSYVKEMEHKYNLTPEASAKLMSYFEKFKKPGTTILSEVTVYDVDYQLVGKIDLVVIDENNQVHMFDFKTKIGGFENFGRDWFAKAGEPTFFPMSMYTQAGVQLTAYANMWKRLTNTDVTSMHVIPLKPTVDQNTGVISNYELDRSFNGKDIIDIGVSAWMPLFYSSQGIVMNKNDNQDIVSKSEHAQLIQESKVLWEKKVMSLEDSPERQLLLKIVQSIQNTIEVTRKRSTHKQVLKQTEWLNKILREDDVQKALSYAVDIAHEITKKTFLELQELKKSGDVITPAMLYRYKDTVSAFNILDEYESLLTGQFGIYENQALTAKQKEALSYSDFTVLRDRLSKAISYKNSVKGDYERIGLDLMAEFLFPFYTKVRGEFKKDLGEDYRKIRRHKTHGDGILDTDKKKDVLLAQVDSFNLDITEAEYVKHKLDLEKNNLDNKSKVMIRKELKKASRDISVLEAWIDNILDSPDAVTGALVKAFVIYDDNARLEIERSRLAMLPVLREWEEFSKQYGKDYQKAYDFTLERDLKTGELTGHIITKWHSSLMTSYRSLLSYLNTVDIAEDKKAAYMNHWKEINMPMNKVEFQKAYIFHLDTLLAEDKITEEERSYLVAQSAMSKSKMKRITYGEMVKLGKIRDNTEDLILQWLQKNTWKYREPGEQWVNPQWAKLEKILANPNDPRTKMYNMIIETAERADDLIPAGVKLGTRLPGVIKQKNERLASGQNLAEFAKGSLSKSLDFKVDDTHRVHTELLDLEGNARYFVPVHYTGMVTKTIKDKEGNEMQVFDAEEQSFDLTNIYFNYLASAIDFQWKNNILPEMELHRTLLKNRDIVQRDAFNNIKVRARKMFAGETSEVDEITTKGGNISKQFDTWLLYALYGQAEKDLGVIPGTNIDAGKLVGNIQRFTALNLLGFNFISGVANLGLGEILQGIEAFAGQHIGIKEYHKAQAFYMANFTGILGDVESRQPDNIVSLLLKEFNVLHAPKKANLTDGRFAAMLTSDTAFFWNHMGEHKMQTTFLLATLEKRRAYNSKGEDIGSILSHYKVKDGVLVLDKEVDLDKSDWHRNEGNFGRGKFEHYVRGLLTRLHGAYSDLERVAIQQNAITSMAYMFRKFVVPGFRRRWGALRYEERTENFVEGNYRTTMRFVGNLYKTLKSQKALMLSREWALMSELEKANIIRTIGEVVMLIAAIILANVAIKFTEDDDEELDLIWNFFAYQTLRLQSELLFFTSPNETMKILRSPAASVTIIENTLKLLGQLTGPGWEYYEQGPWKDHMKIEKTLIDMSIGVKQYYRLRDIGELVDIWKI